MRILLTQFKRGLEAVFIGIDAADIGASDREARRIEAYCRRSFVL
jgi:hypothetical protein